MCADTSKGDIMGDEKPVLRQPAEVLENLSREQLIEYVKICSKNFFAIDGTWFQSVELEEGMDAAMSHDACAWERYTGSEGRRVKAFLGLGERPGLEGLAKALPLKLTVPCNEADIRWDGDDLVFRIVSCRVQAARGRKGMGYHPCKPVGLIEYGGFARAIDDRIECTCVSCYPDITDCSCACAWRFHLKED